MTTLPGPNWSWLIEPTTANPVGIARRHIPGTVRRWYWRIVVVNGPTYSTDSEARARKIRQQELGRGLS